MRDLDPETNVTVKLGDLQELQEIWWGFTGLQIILDWMRNADPEVDADAAALGVYYAVKPLFTRLEELCFDGGLDANEIELRINKAKEGKKNPDRPKVVK